MYSRSETLRTSLLTSCISLSIEWRPLTSKKSPTTLCVSYWVLNGYETSADEGWKQYSYTMAYVLNHCAIIFSRFSHECEKRLLTSSYLSVCLSVRTTRLPLDGLHFSRWIQICTHNFSITHRFCTMAFLIIDFSEFLVFSSVIFLYMNKYFKWFWTEGGHIQFHSFIQYSVWRQVQSLLQNDASI